jgi:flagellar basal-body rod protein FlgC
MIDSRLYPAIEDRMDWTARRQQVLSNNIANIDTPGFHSKDVSFSDQLQMLQVSTPNPKHIVPIGMDSRMQQYEVGGNADMKDNSVDLDREMSELTRNGLQYVAMIQFVSQKLKTLRSAINEGGKDIVFQNTAFGSAMRAADGGSEGVEVGAVIDDTTTPFDLRYDPGHPDADPTTGYVSYPNVNTSEEMINMMSAARSYEANIAAIAILKTMINRTLELGR